jgi:hypothetical protein
MKRIDLGQTIAILANVGVIAGIVFLALELRQNQASLDEANALNRADSATEALQYFNEVRTLLAQDEKLSAIWLSGKAGNDLTSVDRERFANLCTMELWAFVTLHQRYDALGQTLEAKGIVDDARKNIEPPGMLECWEDNREVFLGNGHAAFVAAVEHE